MLTKDHILKLLKRLNQKLAAENIKGELYLLGGAVMCLAFSARASTKDLDAVFEPRARIRQIACELAREEGIEENWLNDAVKGFLSEAASFNPYLELSNLRILVASPEYLLAMKCLSMRIGREFHDEGDIRFLLRYLNVESYDMAISIISSYYPLERMPQKSLYALEEILSSGKPV